ncbi:MAG: LysR family transcriptional regulator [Deltaproteobacteria bacterium]|jgi:DNA-binding transcriptional LysR family regulator|nr:LysR family transcriptional regulator [Deltaproteobacteria bacterium]
MDLNQMLIFAKVAELQSFTKAGRELGIEKSNVSTKVTKLEDRLGVSLLNRTTRSVTLTEAGAGYYQFCLDILEKAEEADSFAESLNAEPQGTIRVSAPVDAGALMTKNLIKPFLEKYHKLKVDLCLTNRKVDLIKERYDIAIRAGTFPQEDSSYTTWQIARSDSRLYASPAYLKKWGEPKTVEVLEKMEMIVFATEQGFENKVSVKAKIGKKNIHFSPIYKLKVNDMATFLESTIHGLGIAILPTSFIDRHLKNRSLIPILPEIVFPEVGFYAIYPSKQLRSVKLNVFFEYLKSWKPML